MGTTTLGGFAVLEAALEGPGEEVEREAMIPIEIPLKAGRKRRGGS